MSLFVLLLSSALAQDVSRGEYLARAASCRECHTVPGGAAFAGGEGLVTEYGTFYPPNISSDSEYGIGAWTFADFKSAMRFGISPANQYYYPSFPYRSFTKMNDEDLASLFAYLQTQPAIHRPSRPHALGAPFDMRNLLFFWRELYFRGPSGHALTDLKTRIGPFVPDPAKSPEWNRGAYYVEAVLHCTECHTPRGLLGGLIDSEWMAGSQILFSGRTPPNITPDPATGITWTQTQWMDFLSSGVDPQGRSPGAEMALAVRAASGLTKADRQAVVTYLRSLPPVRRGEEAK